MRAGILIIGSLLWDSAPNRDDWRKSHLQIGERMFVKTPIRYGRRSQKRCNTFTMTFGYDNGQAVLVPCTAKIKDVAGIVEEAKHLWKAEDHNSPAKTIGKRWGCVGAMFRSESTSADWRKEWAEHFRETKTPLTLPVNSDGILVVPWPMRSEDGTSADMDVILATATEAEPTRPTHTDIADAWLVQHGGHERYFFENVRHGIRTREDGLIWRRIKEQAPHWLQEEGYAEAVSRLQTETEGSV